MAAFHPIDSLRRLSDDELVHQLRASVVRERERTITVLFLLIEVDRRRLHRRRYSASLYSYCIDRLGYSNSAAHRRIQAARCLRDYPAVLPLLRSGQLNLSTLALVSRVINPANATPLLQEVAGKAQPAVHRVIAEYARPQPPRRESIRAVPVAVVAAPCRGMGSLDDLFQVAPETSPATASRTTKQEATKQEATGQQAEAAGESPASEAANPPPSKEVRFDIRLQVDAQFMEQLERVRVLVSRAHPGVSLADVVAATMREYLTRKDPAQRTARRKKRRTRAEVARNEGSFTEPENRRVAPRSAIPQQIRDAVMIRDGMRCTYVGWEGRCPETRGLHLDHIVPYSRGGSNHRSNLRLRCAVHNQMAADDAFGTEYMEIRRRRRPASSHASGPASVPDTVPASGAAGLPTRFPRGLQRGSRSQLLHVPRESAPGGRSSVAT